MDFDSFSVGAGGEIEKTGQTDDTIPLNAEAIRFLTPCFKVLVACGPTDIFSKIEYLQFFSLCQGGVP